MNPQKVNQRILAVLIVLALTLLLFGLWILKTYDYENRNYELHPDVPERQTEIFQASA